MTFQRIVHLKAHPGLPLVKKLAFEQVDPQSPLHTMALSLTGRTLLAQVSAPPKSKAYEIEVLKDPPAPGDYVFLLVYMGVEHEISVELLQGEGAKQLQSKLIAAIKALGLGFILGACATSCSDAHEIVVAGWWPGVDFTLSLVEQPTTDPPEDQVDIDVLQDNAPIAVFSTSTQVVDDMQVITLKLDGETTAGIPTAGDGVYRWHLIATLDTDPTGDVLELARGHLVMERV